MTRLARLRRWPVPPHAPVRTFGSVHAPARWLGFGLALLLAGCATRPPELPTPAATGAAASTWQAPLPHGGDAASLKAWWSQLDDPLLPELIEAAQASSPDLATARSRLEQARAASTGATAALGPTLVGQSRAVRAKPDLITPLSTTQLDGLVASWEPDIFGALAAARAGAEARERGAGFAWHEARVAVAATAAAQYVQYRACEIREELARNESTSRDESARLAGVAERAGLQASTAVTLAQASAAQARSQLEAVREQCLRGLKGLVEVTGMDERVLLERLAPARARLPQPAAVAVPPIPADLLQQRPDLARATMAVLAAAADVGQAQARRKPGITLTGSIGRMRARTDGISTNDTVWSLGPIQLTLPIFDGGALAAAEASARARYEEATALLRARVRQSVREVEEALVSLDAMERRQADARLAAEGHARVLADVRQRQAAGLATLFELEEARRSALAARQAVADLDRQRVLTWISLYQAVGGGWEPAAADTRPQTPATAASPTATTGPTSPRLQDPT